MSKRTWMRIAICVTITFITTVLPGRTWASTPTANPGNNPWDVPERVLPPQRFEHAKAGEKWGHNPIYAPGHDFGLVGPPVPASTCCVTPASTNPLQYRGGYVDEGGTYAYNVFWQPTSFSNQSTYNQRANYFFSDINGTSYYNDLTQYYDTVGGGTHAIANHSQLTAAWTDTSSYPGTSLSESQVTAEVDKAIQQNGWYPGSFAQINVILGPGTTIGANFCGYHDAYNSTARGYIVQFTAINYNVQNCYPTYNGSYVCPNGCTVDSALTALSHETFEITTDPFTGCGGHTAGWYDPVQTTPNSNPPCTGEIGDKCNLLVDNLLYDGGLANHQWNGRNYVLQDEWNNYATNLGTGGACTSYGPQYP